MSEQIKEEILRRRKQILVHSHVYYTLNRNIISDQEFDNIGKRLVELQRDYPEIAREVKFADRFDGFDGTTGYHLDTRVVAHIAEWLVRYCEGL